MSQSTNQEQPSKFPQYIAPIIILLLAIGAAVYGVLWAADEDTTVTNDAPTEQAENQPDNDDYLEAVQDQYPEAPAHHQEALAAAQAEMETYVLSAHQLELVLADPEFSYEMEQDAIDFAVEHVDVDWNEQAHQYLAVTLQEFPDADLEEVADLMQNDPEGPQFTAEQVDYAVSQMQ